MRTSDLLAYNVIVLLVATNTCAFRLTSKSKRFLPTEELLLEDDQQGSSSSNEERVFFHDSVPEGVVKVKTGSSITLDCEAGGTPTPTIHWLFEGGRIPQGNRHNVFDDEAIYEMSLSGDKVSSTLRLGNTKSRLYIDCVTPTHAGTYTCVAETPTKRVTTSGVLEVDVTYEDKSSRCFSKRSKSAGDVPARVYMWTSQRLEYEGNDAQLFCRAEGSPIPALNWYSPDDHLITVKDDRYVLLDNGDLVVRGVSWQDMGLYRCVAENKLGKDEASIFIYPTAED